MDDFEKELKSGYLEEASQLLADAEQCFLSLEKASEDASIVEKIFRLAHNLKGSARAVGFMDIGEFTHQLESLLLKIKNKEMQIQSSTVSLLLECNDHLRMMVDTLRTDMDARVDSQALMAEIGRHLNGEVQSEEAPESLELVPPPASAFEEEAVTEEVAQVEEIQASEQEEEVIETEVSFDQLTSVVENSLREEKHRLELVSSGPAPVQPAQPQKTATPTGPVDESIRVSLKRLERLMNNVGELVILQAVLNQQKHSVQSMLMQKTIDQLAKITKDIQDISMSLRMVPVKQTFQKMQRIVRDTSKALSKEVVLDISGEDTELDKIVLEQIGDPLVHLVRNAVDHGLESTEERVARGKSSQGTVWLSAFHQGSHIVIEVRDDGHGLDAQKLIAKAREKGVIKPNQELTDEQAYHLVFAPGFSTKTEITDISGRGVGMDVVKNNIQQLQGEIQLETEKGKGTCFRILLPLTLSIIDGMVIRAGEERYVVPISQVHESVQPEGQDVHFVTGLGEVLSLRGENIPLFRLTSVLGRKTVPRPVTESIAIVIRNGKSPFSILVDDIIGHQQVVIKRLGHGVQNMKGISGGAILGDGRAALILDFNELASRATPATSAITSAVMKGAA
ncbi:MAG: hypothetical protein A2X94_06095 [Bdellovibrionales bacterium GWB1_55_8]|nr:MAG: hypothetical protein A2X94_06095 [Bdellovibrionales bacterium GWB1_55_8]